MMTSNNGIVSPFLKWAGGKRWFVAKHADLLPRTFNRYFEPFLGSGAVYFHLQPENAYLGDSNKDLIDTYIAIQKNWKLVLRHLKEHKKAHCREYYYRVRAQTPRSLQAKAARFIYLNRTCWNGLYRVNLQGKFNVPIGTRNSVIFDTDDFEKVSQALQGAFLLSGDFEELVNMAEENDLLFVDPPYTVRHNNNGFLKYNETLFSWEDQKRLFRSLDRARDRGASIVATNACSQCVMDLYTDAFSTKEVSRNSLISPNLDSRKKFKELVIYTESRDE
ncbi:DNA adenine methylase [Desulfatibacillum aliphaticivorans]|nr:Dam family site-specific DNA-(adenine-N6)-methyltransferase [Desulfatibacillum aliphaticivorans]